MRDFVIGVDLGQAQDYSTMAVLHRNWWRKGQRPEVETARLWHDMPLLMRWDLGTPYPKIVARIEETVKRSLAESQFNLPGVLVVDRGGPGRPVIDLLKEKRLSPVGVTITSGSEVALKDEGYTVPKKDICSALVVAAQSGDFKYPAELDLRPVFEDELRSFGYQVNQNTGKQRYESMDANVHDDLVVAAALALWYSTTILSKKWVEARESRSDEFDRYNPVA